MTAPELSPMAKAPEQDCEWIAYVTVLVVPSASDADAVISAEAPLDTLSARVLASESVSAGAPTLNSSASVMVTCMV